MDEMEMANFKASELNAYHARDGLITHVSMTEQEQEEFPNTSRGRFLEKCSTVWKTQKYKATGT